MKPLIPALRQWEVPLRSVAVLFAIVYFVGITWWPREYPSIYYGVYLWSPVLALAAWALLPARFLANVLVLMASICIAVIAIANIAEDAARDLHLIDGADYPALVLRVVIVLTLVLTASARFATKPLKARRP